MQIQEDPIFGPYGCIPMVPGSFAARAILGLFAVSTGRAENTSDVLLTSIEYTLRLAFTIGAIGTGLAIPALLMRGRTQRRAANQNSSLRANWMSRGGFA